jgi:hypothetical protein
MKSLSRTLTVPCKPKVKNFTAGSAHSTEPISGAAIALLHALAAVLAVLIPTFLPGSTLLLVELLGTFAALTVFN